ncbi:MAG: tetratricopeptide repeat protein [Deltaproteobacteria bacterium]|nr:tetratricopeptide repeat protein [Deltaproteobacteria bacterium]
MARDEKRDEASAEGSADNETSGAEREVEETQGSDAQGPDEAEDDSFGRGRARAAAKALGVADDDDDQNEASGETAESTDAEGKPKAPTNRAERRRALALKRRTGKASGDETRDRNARKRQEQLDKRQRAASGVAEDTGDEPSNVGLAVDDALARTGAAAGRWFKSNWRWIQWALVAGLFGGVGALVYVWRSGMTTAATSDLLASAVAAEQARVLPPEKDKRTDDEKKKSDRVVYASYDERAKVALERYQKVATAEPKSGAALLARLGIAGTKLDRREWDEAVIAYEEVLRSKLAEVDVDVKGRALEGVGFAHEGKKDYDRALATFDKLAEVSEPMFKVLAKFHKARVLAAKGDKDGAKKLLEEARKDIETNELEVKRVSGGGMNPYQGLRTMVEQALKRIDPSAVPPRFMPGGKGGPQITPEQIQQLLQQKGLTPGMPGQPE